MTEVHYLSLDPGETTGWTSFSDKGFLITFGVVKGNDACMELIEKLAPKVIIYEDWRLDPSKAQGLAQKWDKQVTVRLIGAIEDYGRRHKVPLHNQPSSIKPIGYRWANTPQPKDHSISHAPDSYVHGVYFFVKNKIRTIHSFVIGETG